ncbi:MAG: hypothetical protein JSS20_13065 [Proteobacteria bacterium]|nr:hypothetical protein [Pseudomonadota bacterium]
MRLTQILFAAGTVAALLAGQGAANAADLDHKPAAAHHHVHHVYKSDRWAFYKPYGHYWRIDPYAWRYSPRGYYPYYGSEYWTDARFIKWRNRQHLNNWNGKRPHYYKSWGYPKPWNNRAWHEAHDGRVAPWHW